MARTAAKLGDTIETINRLARGTIETAVLYIPPDACMNARRIEPIQRKDFVMTPEQIALVQDSFRKVVLIKDTAAQLFYAHLFELDPSLKSLFQSDMTQQGRKLMAAMGIVVQGLNNLKLVLPMVQELGRRHAGYGVEPQHYETVAAALLWTLEQGLGNDFTEDTKQAWATAYGLLASTMIEAGTRKAA